jgi:protein EFR3
VSQAFPEALFHQLLLAMMHPDNKTRIGSHRVLSTIVAPSLLCPWSTMSFPIPAKGSSLQDLLQLVLSAFSSETIIEEVWAKDGIQESLGSPYLDAFHLTAFDEV